MTDELLEWPPDVFALTDLILGTSQAYRFLFSLPTGGQWPPAGSEVWTRPSAGQPESGPSGPRIPVAQRLPWYARSGACFVSGLGWPSRASAKDGTGECVRHC